jgi:hypothetical protein
MFRLLFIAIFKRYYTALSVISVKIYTASMLLKHCIMLY